LWYEFIIYHPYDKAIGLMNLLNLADER